MSLFLIGPWLHALWNRAQEAGPSEAVNVHPERHQRVWEHVAHQYIGGSIQVAVQLRLAEYSNTGDEHCDIAFYTVQHYTANTVYSYTAYTLYSAILGSAKKFRKFLKKSEHILHFLFPEISAEI